MSIDDFRKFSFSNGDITHDVYVRGEGPAVVLMHELPGMGDQCIAVGEAIAAAGFTVYLPLLFGAPGDDHPILFGAQLCVSREFRLFALQGGSPIVTWLRALGRKALDDCRPALGIGVVGMCLTGNFAIAMMVDAHVLAPVSCEPALPMGLTAEARQATAVSSDDLKAAAESGTPLVCMRFSNDKISPEERFAAIKARFGDKFLGTELDSSPGNPNGLPTDAHSVLTSNFPGKAQDVVRKALTDVIAFLNGRLKFQKT